MFYTSVILGWTGTGHLGSIISSMFRTTDCVVGMEVRSATCRGCCGGPSSGESGISRRVLITILPHPQQPLQHPVQQQITQPMTLAIMINMITSNTISPVDIFLFFQWV